MPFTICFFVHHIILCKLCTVVHENSRRLAISEAVGPEHQASTLIPRSESLRSRIFTALMLSQKETEPLDPVFSYNHTIPCLEVQV